MTTTTDSIPTGRPLRPIDPASRGAAARVDMYQPMTAGEWALLREQAAVLVSTGFLPAHIKTANQALAIMLKGRELRVPPWYALSNIVVISGKPCANAELMLALVFRDHGDHALTIVESDAQRCTAEYRRRGWSEPRRFSFTIEDARTADLAGKGTWAKYPSAMLRARCISAIARMAFPDSIGGLYTPEELGAEVMVSDDGDVHVQAIPATTEPAESDALDPAPAQGRAPLRPQQHQQIGILRRELGLSDETYYRLLEQRYGVSSCTLLSSSEAKAFIEQLRLRLMAKADRPQPPDQEAPARESAQDEPQPAGGDPGAGTPEPLTSETNTQLDMETARQDTAAAHVRRWAQQIEAATTYEALKAVGQNLTLSGTELSEPSKAELRERYQRRKEALQPQKPTTAAKTPTDPRF